MDPAITEIAIGQQITRPIFNNFLASLSSKADRLLMPTAKKKVLLIGSSHITGTMATGEKSYADIVGEQLSASHTFTSIAVGGTNTTDWLNQIESALKTYNPDYVWIGLSLGNEFAAGGDHATLYQQFVRNLALLAGTIRANGPIPVISSGYPRGDYSPSDYVLLQSLNRQIADLGYPVVDIMGLLDDGSGHYLPAYNAGDGLHVNDAGQQALSSLVPLDIFRSIPVSYRPLRFDKETKGVKINLDATPNVLYADLPQTAKSITVGFDVREETPVTRTATAGLVFLNNTKRLRVRLPSGSLGIGAEEGAVANSTQTLTGVWKHVVMRYNHVTGLQSLFVNGVNVAERVTDTGLTTTRVVLGGVELAASTAIGASFRNFTIHLAPLTNEAIADLARGVVGRGSLLLFSPLSESNPLQTGQRLRNDAGYNLSIASNQNDAPLTVVDENLNGTVTS